MAKQSPLARTSLAEQIRDVLLDRIGNGTLAPGDRLIELKIAEEMQTSQAPVREALRQLEATGLIESRHNKGTSVRAIDHAELLEIYAVRAELEGLAAETVAQKSPKTGAALLGLCDQMETAHEQGDITVFIHLNTQFHQLIVSSAGNQTLLGIWERLDIQTRTLANLTRLERDLGPIMTEHRAIATAISQGDGVQARDTIRGHITGVVI